MNVTVANYHRLAKLIGLLLTLMGVGLIAVFAMFITTGTNPLAGCPAGLEGPGLLILATIGAFTLPLGASLFGVDAATSARMRIAGYALELMALLRLVAFANPQLRAEVGYTPLLEFFVLGSIGLIALLVRPLGEAPIDMRTEIDLDAPASEAWQVLGEQFGAIGEWAVAIRSSSLDGDVAVGTVRTCEIGGFGPVGAGRITEELTELDADAMRFTYAARTGLPRMIQSAVNRWSVQSLGRERCRVRSHASIDVAWWALPLTPWIGWGMRLGVPRFVEELRHRVELGVAHPRKRAALAQR